MACHIKKNIEELEVMDRSLLRYITGAHAKTQNEFLYLETGVLNIEKIISNRRMMYFQTIVKRDESEITRKIYDCQKNNPVKGDWIELLQKDFADLGMEMDDEFVRNETKLQFKSRVKKHIEMHMFSELKRQQEGHSKISHICYKQLKTQEYLKSHMFNNHEAFLLFSLRSRNSKLFKANFSYNLNQVCPMNGCEELDQQEHLLECDKNYPLESRTQDISYSDIFSYDITKQLAATKLFSSLLERREVASADSTGPQCCTGLPGECCDHCTQL